jgi:hypothetical protein
MTSLALLGGLGGLGRGMNDVGRQMELDALEARRQQNLADIAAARDASREEIAANRLAAVGGGRAGSRSSGGGGGGGSSLRDLMDDPTGLAFSSGERRESVDDALAMAKGQRLTKEVEGELPVDEEGNVIEGPGAPKTVDKYTPGQAEEVRMSGTRALRQAMKVSDPKNADDLSRSERTDQGTKYAAEYRAGNDRAGESALINDSKPAFDDGSSNATGRVVSGSLADAKAEAEGTKAGAAVTRANAAAAKSARAGGGSSANPELRLNDQERKNTNALLASAQKELTAAVSKDEIAAAKAKIAKYEARLEAGNDRIDSQRKPSAEAPAAKTGSKEMALPAADLAKAKVAIARNPANREEVIRRAKAAGFSTAGL